ncbi:MAG: hypothetical protein MUC88_02075 [Planctomycetes bacterium]|nr:hypothetical protein [Planctomycetota bacterium]
METLLRRLAEAVLAGVPVTFTAHRDFRYRAALRMQIGDIAIPGAAGGILNPLAGLPDDVELASVHLCLEAWASARSGEAIGLAELPFPLVRSSE